jgi:hypothetical protein
MSDSPRTDEKEVSHIPETGDYYELLEFTRGLEGELAAKDALLAEVRADLAKIHGQLQKVYDSYIKLIK